MSVRGSLWEAINRYVVACGGDPSSRMMNVTERVVAEVERAIDDECARAVSRTIGEALNSGDGTYKP
jgi:hypothetical protein